MVKLVVKHRTPDIYILLERMTYTFPQRRIDECHLECDSAKDSIGCASQVDIPREDEEEEADPEP